MKRFLRIFELSKNEQRVVLIVMFVLIAIAFVGYERRIRPLSRQRHPQWNETVSESAEPDDAIIQFRII